MPLEFPNTPANGTTNAQFVYDSAITAWRNQGSTNNVGAQIAALQAADAYDYHPNYVINGGFDIWQRGTSFTNPNNGYTADRWNVSYSGSGSTKVFTQQTFTPGTNVGKETLYYMNINQSVAGTGASWNEFSTLIEDARTLAGKTVTVSFWAKSSTSTTLPGMFFGQTFQGSTRVDTAIGSTIPLTTSWAKYSYTVTLPSVAGKTINAGSYLLVAFQLPLNATFNIDIANVQLEEGFTATPFRRNSNSIQGEFFSCQRYYRYTSSGQAPIPNGSVRTVTMNFDPPMRTTPTVTSSGAGLVANGGDQYHYKFFTTIGSGETYVTAFSASAEL